MSHEEFGGPINETPKKVVSQERLDQILALPLVEFEPNRKGYAEELGFSLAALTKAYSQHQNQKRSIETSGTDELVECLDLWPDTVDGDELAKSVKTKISTYCKLQDCYLIAATLWILASYAINQFRIFPKLCVTSPQKRCGKTTLLETIAALCNRALLASNITSAVIFRLIEECQPTLLIDEVDTFIDGNDELRGLVNSGHTKAGAFVFRVEGDSNNRKPKKFSTWTANVLAKIGAFPDTIADRGIDIRSDRKLVGDRVAKLPVDHDDQCLELRQKCLRWAEENGPIVSLAEPRIPDVNNDRAMDNWSPLLAVADQLGGDWPNLARAAMRKIETRNGDETTDDLAIELLSDLRDRLSKWNNDNVHSADLVRWLNDLEDRPWPGLRNDKGLNQHMLAKLLRPFHVTPTKVRVASSSPKQGYPVSALNTLFSRYLELQPEQRNKPQPIAVSDHSRVEQSTSNVPLENTQ